MTVGIAYDEPDVDVLIIGAGFSGLGMAIALSQEGGVSFRVLERRSDVGGTWNDNTYPGCACDIPSHLYSFSFNPNPNWSRMYPPQPEIHAYLRETAEKFGVYRNIQFDTTVESMVYDEARKCWRVTDTRGRVLMARAVVSAMGALSNPERPKQPGLEDFKGEVFHSAEWRHDLDLTDKRVAVVGTGASAIQFIPQIASKVRRLHLFQRTAPWVMPKRDREMSPWEQRLFRIFPAAQAWLRSKIYWRNEITLVGFIKRRSLMRRAEQASRAFLERTVPDEMLRQKLTPDYSMGCKRILLSNDYFPALSRPNVEVITDGVERVTAGGIVGRDGVERPVDCIIYATGFDIMNVRLGPRVIGRGGRQLSGDWADGPHAYLGLTMSGYPNFFMLLGPNTGLGHNSMVYMIESQIRYVVNSLQLMRRQRAAAMELRPAVQHAFNSRIDRAMTGSVWNSGGCVSWYRTAAGRNYSLWPDFTFIYRRRTRKVDVSAYEFEEGPRPVAAPLDALHALRGRVGARRPTLV